ncbi:hypothetical protein [ANMV-1 virus]|nr:hypothetical protein [ANMV-1 virus]
MKRYYGSAVFEGKEVTDRDFDKLTKLRVYEADQIASTFHEFLNKERHIIRSITQEVESVQREGSSLGSTIRQYRSDQEHNLNWLADELDSVQQEVASGISRTIAASYTLPVYMLRCAKGACELCRAKYGTIGTYRELMRQDCIPPFHDSCRCWLEEIGYVVMSGRS